jgi:hypothetical protein
MSSEHQKFPPMTSRELAEAIDQLICLRVLMGTTEYHSNSGGEEQAEQAELLIRRISDGFKRLDHNPGVAVAGKNDQIG